MSLIFCRHGQTVFNLEDRFQGISDSPLTQKGIDQAHRLNDYLIRNFNVKKFIISPLPRVVETYEIASAGLNAEVEEADILREVSYGEWEEKERKEIDPETLERRSHNRFAFVHPGSFHGIKGQSYKDKAEELAPYFAELEQKYKIDDYDVVILAHHGVMLAAVKYFDKKSDEEINDFRASNNSVFVVDFKENKTFLTKIN